MGISNSSARHVVKCLLAQRGLLKGRLSEDRLLILEFATELRRVIEPRREHVTFAERREAAAYVQKVAKVDQGSECS